MSNLSDTLCHYLPDANSAVLSEVFDLVRPAGSACYEELKSAFGAMVLMVAKDQSFAVRGQFVELSKEPESLIFIGAPWLSWITQNTDGSNIRMKDFAATDVQLDQLIFLSTEKQNLNDLKDLTEELKAARDKAEKVNEIQSKFFALMSHEMRTPLNGVATALDLIDDQYLDDESLKMLQIARSSSLNLKRVIDQVLNYSKLQAGGFANEPHTFDLKRTLTSVIDLHTPSANQQNNKLVLEGVVGPSFFRADEAKLRQVLLNLVGNALKFTIDGEVSICCSFDEASQLLTIKVRDSGEGIPIELQPRIFDSYWTFDSNRCGSKGTGLGLNICKQFIDIMGGQIGFESTPGQGTEFQITLPVNGFEGDDALSSYQADNSNGQIEGQRETELENQPQFSGQILLVEDNKTNQYLSQLLLEKRGLKVHLADNGVEAIAQVDANAYDLVFMDISMPVMDGLEATAKLRESFSKEQLPIVAMTAHAGDEDHNRFIAAGMNSAMSKPIDISILNATLARWCKPGEFVPIARTPAPKAKVNVLNDTPIVVQLIDKEESEKLHSELGVELFVQIGDVFKVEATERLGEILAAYEAQDLEDLAKKSHSIRSSAATLGCTPLADQLKKIELLARESDFDSLHEPVGTLPNLLTQSLIALEKYALGLV